MATRVRVQHGEVETRAAYDRVLRQWPVPYTERDVTTSFGQTHVIVSGADDAPPIVFLHALYATAAVWYPNPGPLSHRFGPSPWTPLASLTRAVRRGTPPIWTTSQGGSQACWTGWASSRRTWSEIRSGAFLSLYFAMKMPERVRRLVLIGPAATFSQIIPFYVHLFGPKMVSMLLPRLPGLPRLLGEASSGCATACLSIPPGVTCSICVCSMAAGLTQSFLASTPQRSCVR